MKTAIVAWLAVLLLTPLISQDEREDSAAATAEKKAPRSKQVEVKKEVKSTSDLVFKTPAQKELEPKKNAQNNTSSVASSTAAKDETARTEQAGKKTLFNYPGLPSLDLFPLSDPGDPNQHLPLPPLPPLAELPELKPFAPAPRKKRVNGRWVITAVPKKRVDEKPEQEMRKINGKWVICIKGQ